MTRFRTISVYCAGCRKRLLKYHKGGRGGLVKCMHDRIARDDTEGDGTCPRCQVQWGRPMTLAGRSGWKVIQGRIFVKGMSRK